VLVYKVISYEGREPDKTAVTYVEVDDPDIKEHE
jgi:hypothetical protein